MIEFPKECTGCTACSQVCPKSAIEMILDERGFLIPNLRGDRCIGCNLCMKTCADRVNNKLHVRNVFAVKNKDYSMRQKSQSGGYAYVMSEYFINKGGVVYGATIDDDFSVKHIRVDSKDKIGCLCGSKYTCSNIVGVFEKIKEDINKEVNVLFIGLPCQVAGLKAYIGENKRLATVDLICSGAPSQKVWLSYVDWQKDRHKNTPLKKVVFRDMDVKWGEKPREKFYFGTKEYKYNYFLRIFASHNADKETCFNCAFASVERVGDITIGDYWGIEKIVPDFSDEVGVSLILLNSEEGVQLHKEIEDKIEWCETSLKDACSGNPRLESPQSMPNTYDQFWIDYLGKDFNYVVKHYGKRKLISGIINRIKRLFK